MCAHTVYNVDTTHNCIFVLNYNLYSQSFLETLCISLSLGRIGGEQHSSQGPPAATNVQGIPGISQCGGNAPGTAYFWVRAQQGMP